MFDAARIQELKQVNVSTDAEKTKQRATEVWKSASKEDQATILNLADVARSTVQRAYKTGNMSAKLIVPFSQTLDIDPFYLTGQADERGVCTEDALRSFLSGLGYQNLPPKRRRRRKEVLPTSEIDDVADGVSIMPESFADLISEPESASVPAPSEAPALTADERELVDILSEEDMLLLMRAIMLRAKAGGENALLAQNLKKLLLGLE